jgi:alpha-L-fucosidase 2
VFASAPDQVIVIRLTADKSGSISFKANLRGVRNQTHSNYATDYFRMDPYGADGLVLTGKSADDMGVAGKLKYEARIKAVPEGGTMKTDGVDLIIENANAVTLYFAAATNFVNYKDVSANQHQRVDDYFKNIQNKSYTTILAASVADYKQYFDRVSLQLPITENSFLPIPERIQKIQTSPDPSLSALSYNFGRYLMIASSRLGTEPANLQGIWNDDMNPSWDSKYTTNINTQMNYWPVESSNLSECAEPLVRMIREALWRKRLGFSSDHRLMARGRTYGWPHVGNIYRRRGLVMHPSLGALSIHNGCSVSQRDVSVDERLCAVFYGFFKAAS